MSFLSVARSSAKGNFWLNDKSGNGTKSVQKFSLGKTRCRASAVSWKKPSRQPRKPERRRRSKRSLPRKRGKKPSAKLSEQRPPKLSSWRSSNVSGELLLDAGLPLRETPFLELCKINPEARKEAVKGEGIERTTATAVSPYLVLAEHWGSESEKRSRTSSTAEAKLDAWQLAKVLVVRSGQGAIVKLSGSDEKAWLPLEKMRSCPGRSEEEICEALRKPIKVRVDSSRRHTGLPTATMWNDEDDEDQDGAFRRWQRRKAERGTRERERKIDQLRRAYDPSEWLDGSVVSVKNFGIFVDAIHDVRVMIPVGYIPDTLLLNGTPDLDVGSTVQFRICGYRGKDHKGQDRFSCSMLPPAPPKEEEERSTGKGKGKMQKGSKGGADRGRKGGAANGEQTSGYSVWVPDRVLESESTLARQEKFEVNALHATYLEQQYGQTDRRATLARKGFTVVDYATSLQLAQAIKPKTEVKADVTTALKPTPVWLTFESRRKLVGKIQISASMTTSEKERLAVDAALAVANDAIQDGANIRKVDVNDDKVLIRLSTDGGLQFCRLLHFPANQLFRVQPWANLPHRSGVLGPDMSQASRESSIEVPGNQSPTDAVAALKAEFEGFVDKLREKLDDLEITMQTQQLTQQAADDYTSSRNTFGEADTISGSRSISRLFPIYDDPIMSKEEAKAQEPSALQEHRQNRQVRKDNTKYLPLGPMTAVQQRQNELRLHNRWLQLSMQYDPYAAISELRTNIRSASPTQYVKQRVSIDSVGPEREPAESKSRFHPNGAKRIAWDLLSSFVLVMDTVLLPISLAWDLQKDTTDAPSWVNLGFFTFSLLFWTVDIFINLNTGVFHKGQLVFSKQLIFMQYMRTGLLLDLALVGLDCEDEQQGIAGLPMVVACGQAAASASSASVHAGSLPGHLADAASDVTCLVLAQCTDVANLIDLFDAEIPGPAFHRASFDSAFSGLISPAWHLPPKWMRFPLCIGYRPTNGTQNGNALCQVSYDSRLVAELLDGLDLTIRSFVTIANVLLDSAIVDLSFSRFARIVRIFRFIRLIKLAKVEGFIQEYAASTGRQWIIICAAIANSMFAIGLLNHVLACLWFWLGRTLASEGQSNWIAIAGAEQLTSFQQYLICFRRVMWPVVPAPISPESHFERLFDIGNNVLCILVLGIAIFKISATVLELLAMNEGRLKQRREIRRYLRSQKAPFELVSRVMKFVEYKLEKLQPNNYNTSLISLTLQTELYVNQRSSFLQALPICRLAKEVFPEAFASLCVALKRMVCENREEIFVAGTVAHRMYVTVAGTYLLQGIEGEESQLTGINILEEFSLYMEAVPHNHTLAARTFGELFTLEGDDLVRSLHTSPGCAAMFFEYAKEYASMIPKEPGYLDRATQASLAERCCKMTRVYQEMFPDEKFRPILEGPLQ
ncbi:Potassium voltage-gated channel subfamily H member 2 [Symbiodinium microadriaticum]|uniref:Potassium voltage-gated channel subfamily H member 2 n=1 Tax=Symbiodinium microadriaticum TaxID=2951 RepID=A0A1Q9ETS0_SYMMI|nr:Potassium voltage-gated channel subfamily H member 2 [Symbiodinium microadriaticum]